MITNEWLLLGKIVLELLIVWYMYYKSSPAFLMAIATVNMIFITAFGYQLYAVFDPRLISNMGNSCYATVILCQVLLLYRYGIEVAKISRDVIFINLILFFGLSQSTQYFNRINDVSILSISDTLLQSQSIITAASFLAFYLTQTFVIHAYKNLKSIVQNNTLHCVMISFTAHLIDSLIFFGVAFHGTNNTLMLELFISGMIIKMAFVFMSLPILMYYIFRTPVPLVPCAY